LKDANFERVFFHFDRYLSSYRANQQVQDVANFKERPDREIKTREPFDESKLFATFVAERYHHAAKPFFTTPREWGLTVCIKEIYSNITI
jgi:hypothetical protein